MINLGLVLVIAAGLAMALVFRALRVPLWPLTGGLVGAAAVNLGLSLELASPEGLALVAQLLLGAAIGASIGPEIFRQFARFLAPGALAVGVVLAAGVLFGWAFGASGLMDSGEAMFALMPGGVPEMVAAAVALGFDGAVVIGAHMVRLFTVILSLPLVFWASETIYRRWIAGSADGAG